MRKIMLFIGLACSTLFLLGNERDSAAFNRIKYELSINASITPVGDNTPFYQHSLKHGISSLTPNNGNLRASLNLPIQKEKVFSFGAGVDLVGAYNYQQSFMVQQLYAELQWHFLDLMVGAKEYSGDMINSQLSSGGVAWSGNSRPIPQVRLGIFDFVKIKFLPVQIKGYLAYGKYMDDSWRLRTYNYQNYGVTTDLWYHQKAIMFRSPEEYRFKFGFGLEAVTLFCGTYQAYDNGTFIPERSFQDNPTLKRFIQVIIPDLGDGRSSSTDQAYYYGSHLGCYQIFAEYKLQNNSVLKAYYEDIFNDDGGLIFANQGDGLWGVEWNNSPEQNKPWLQSVVFELFKTTSQSGLVHWRWSDNPGNGPMPPSDRPYSATGQDDYYNKYERSTHSHWGQISGNPLILSPIYNKDGYLNIVNNRILAFHLGLNGFLLPELRYRFLASYRKGWGAGLIPISFPTQAFSTLIECSYSPMRLKGWEGTFSVGMDFGDMLGNNLGFQLGIKKTGLLVPIKKNR